MIMSINILDKFVIRKPAFSIDHHVEFLNLESWQNSCEYLLEFFKSKVNSNALYLASPVLYEELGKIASLTLDKRYSDTNFFFSLGKYFLRMTSRETPFGLFAGCTSGSFGEEDRVVLKPFPDCTIQVRPDMTFMSRLYNFLIQDPVVYRRVLFYPNSSLFSVSDTFRYVEFDWRELMKDFSLSEVDRTVYLEQLLQFSSEGKSFDELVSFLSEFDQSVSTEDFSEYVSDLIANQIFVSSISPTVSGDFYLDFLIREFEGNLHFDDLSEVLSLLRKLKNLFDGIVVDSLNFVESEKLLKELVPFDLKDSGKFIFQSDLYYKPQVLSLSISVKEDLVEFLKLVDYFSAPYVNRNQGNFVSDFTTKYGDREIPLLEALDQDVGIGYGPYRSFEYLGDITSRIPFAQRGTVEEVVPWNKKVEFLLKKLYSNPSSTELEIYESEIKLSDSITNDKCLSFSCLTNIFLMDGKTHYFFDSIWTNSATAILGRFGYGDPGISTLLSEVSNSEQESLPSDYIIAELLHLPGSRVGNVILRPSLSEYEIPYLTNSQKPFSKQILPDDLLVSVVNGKIRIRSKRLNKLVLPRLSNAHNFLTTTLPIYLFLAEFSDQEFRSDLGFKLGPILRSFKYLPRIRFKNFILSLQTWTLLKDDFSALLEENGVQNVDSWRVRLNIPERVTLDERDNKLLIDFKSPFSVGMFISLIKKKNAITLTEYLHNVDSSIVSDTNGNKYSSQFVFSAVNTKKLDGSRSSDISGNLNSVKRNFYLGDEWVYFKVYCSVSRSDLILTTVVSDCLADFSQKGLLKCWFFIRYFDSDGYHLRIRFRLNSDNGFQHVVSYFRTALSGLIQSNIVSKVQLCTYERELERYGIDSIDLAEQLFSIESEIIIAVLRYIDENNLEEERFYICFVILDSILDSFGFSFEEKSKILVRLAESFGREFGKSKYTIKQLSVVYREVKPKIERYLSRKISDPGLSAVFKLIRDKMVDYSEISKNLLENGYNSDDMNKIASLLHMSANRLFKTSQRKQEMVIYDFLSQYYSSLLVRNRKKIQI